MARSCWVCLAVVAFSPTVGLSPAQSDALKGEDLSRYASLRSLNAPVDVPGDADTTKANRDVLAKQAKYLAGRISDPETAKGNRFAEWVQRAIREELPVPRLGPPKEPDKLLAFSREMGPPLVAELAPLIKSPKLGVSVNAARMLQVVGMLGYEGAAELALNTLDDPKSNDGARVYALKALNELFAFVADPANADVTVFDQGQNQAQRDKNTALKNRAIQFLTDFITKPRDVQGLTQEQVDAIRYVRREAVRALGHVRTHRLRTGQPPQVLARPGLVLLKVANQDGIVPAPSLSERAEAVIGFAQMFPVIRAGVDRDVQCDYAVESLGRAILALGTIKLNAANPELPWKVTAERLDHALTQWQNNVTGMQLVGAASVKPMVDQVRQTVLDPLKNGNPANPPDVTNLRNWLDANRASAQSLYKDEPNAQLKVVGN